MILSRITAALLTVVAVIMLPNPSRAQLADGYGVKVGIVFANAADSFDRLDRRTGMTASVHAEKRLLPFLSLIGEIGYVQRGFIETQEERNAMNEFVGIVEANTRLDYLTIPVMAKFGYNLRPATLYAIAGPRLDILFHREPGVFRFTSINFQSETADFYSSPAVGLTMGFGASTTRLFSTGLLLEGRYEFDFTDSFTAEIRETRNNAFSVVVGVAF